MKLLAVFTSNCQFREIPLYYNLTIITLVYDYWNKNVCPENIYEGWGEIKRITSFFLIFNIYSGKVTWYIV